METSSPACSLKLTTHALPILLCATTWLLMGCLNKVMPPSVRHPLVGARAPEFQVESTSLQTVGVPGSYRTKVIVIDFWASWCEACTATMPALNAMWQDHRGDGVMVIGVSVDESESAADSMATELGARFPIVLDPYQRIAASYGVAKIPLTFVIDGAGTVRWVGRNPDNARLAVDVVLSEGTSRRSAFE